MIFRIKYFVWNYWGECRAGNGNDGIMPIDASLPCIKIIKGELSCSVFDLPL